MSSSELNESSQDLPIGRLHVEWKRLIPALLGTIAALFLGGAAMAAFFLQPLGELSLGGKFGVPAEVGAIVGTCLAIAGVATCVRLILGTLPVDRQRYIWALSIVGSSAAVFTLISIAALVWAKDAGPILRTTGNFAWVSVILLLFVFKIRSVDLKD